MSVIATVDVAAEDVTFGGVLTVNPGLHVRLECVVPLGSTFIPYFWASDDSLEAIEAALRTEGDIESFSIADSVDDEALVRVEWARDLDGLLDVMADSGATLLDGEGHADTWTFQLRFDDREDLTAFYRRCVDQGISLNLKDIHNPGVRAADGRRLDLTEAQREALELAFERGYFDIPRRITLTELADEIGISDTAVSQRLRRGLTALLLAILDT
jgi:predicted DNA binding protein